MMLEIMFLIPLKKKAMMKQNINLEQAVGKNNLRNKKLKLENWLNKT